eukprot:2441441-Rhodomonas_salina.3
MSACLCPAQVALLRASTRHATRLSSYPPSKRDQLRSRETSTRRGQSAGGERRMAAGQRPRRGEREEVRWETRTRGEERGSASVAAGDPPPF